MKEIENMKMEMNEKIATHMFQNEQTCKELVVQGQSQIATLFANVLKIIKHDSFVYFKVVHGQ